jgi:hypothetical protein
MAFAAPFTLTFTFTLKGHSRPFAAGPELACSELVEVAEGRFLSLAPSVASA